MPKEALNHNRSRSQICLIHFRKIPKNGRLLTKKLYDLVQKYYPDLSSVDIEDIRYPNAICSTCCAILYAHERGDTKRALPKLHCYSLMRDTLLTRDCQNCQICLLAKSNEIHSNYKRFIETYKATETEFKETEINVDDIEHIDIKHESI
ncbi:unnamed protein product [Meganyctiphanes norvegica]|uniref:Uncharacterized protein n=1 Tax=Meganyctiphanes norvegica TaxID=48144 RepID=A0AAV2PY44_MEGNR